MANLRGQKPPATPKFRPEPDELVRTFLHGEHALLDDAADRYQRAKRAVYAKASRTGRSFDALKSETCAAFDLPARMFNAIRLDLRGMVKSIQEKARYDTAQTEDRIDRGRDGHCWPPPAQIRTRPIKASGSYLG